jgi:arylformamidase
MTANSPDFRNYKTVTNPELFKVAWEPFYAAGVHETEALRKRFRTTTDLEYGAGVGQTLDLYLPDTTGPDTATLVFLHGGAFREGHPLQYGFVGKPFLERGNAFISASYRLAPAAYYPDQVSDTVQLAGWLFRNLGRYGLNPGRVVMCGHSSGALVVALAAVRSDWQGAEGVPQDFFHSIILAGANYDQLEDLPTNLVRDPARRAEGTVHCNIQRVPDRALIVFGVDERNTGDGGRFARSSWPLGRLLSEHGCQTTVCALDADHQGTCRSICDTSSPVYATASAMLDEARRRLASPA